MRILIVFLFLVMGAFVGNIFAYMLSEDYRFFLKKLKYDDQEILYESGSIDDSERFRLVETEINSEDAETPDFRIESVEVDTEDLQFIDIFRPELSDTTEEIVLRDLVSTEREILDILEQGYILQGVDDDEKNETLLFGLTAEYPDPFRMYTNSHFELYMFPTKSYKEILQIFSVLSYELPYTLNPVNNFGSASFFINMMGGFEDGFVRLVFEYENMAFGLKIKKDSYNRLRSVLQNEIAP